MTFVFYFDWLIIQDFYVNLPPNCRLTSPTTVANLWVCTSIKAITISVTSWQVTKNKQTAMLKSILYDLQGRMTKGDNKRIDIEKIFKNGKTNYRKIWKN